MITQKEQGIIAIELLQSALLTMNRELLSLLDTCKEASRPTHCLCGRELTDEERSEGSDCNRCYIQLQREQRDERKIEESGT